MGQAFAEWGLHGVEMLCERVSVLIIVDVLSFSTAVAVAGLPEYARTIRFIRS